jgi:hypothetical protein
MKTKLSMAVVILLAGAVAVFAQHGGKAEPNKIEFAAGKSGATLTGSLANHQEMEYSFTARAGQTVYLKCGSEFDFRLNLPDSDFDTEWNKGTDSFEIPADGEYLLSVRKRLTKTRRARFALTITIK